MGHINKNINYNCTQTKTHRQICVFIDSVLYKGYRYPGAVLQGNGCSQGFIDDNLKRNNKCFKTTHIETNVSYVGIVLIITLELRLYWAVNVSVQMGKF